MLDHAQPSDQIIPLEEGTNPLQLLLLHDVKRFGGVNRLVVIVSLEGKGKEQSTEGVIHCLLRYLDSKGWIWLGPFVFYSGTV